MSNQAETSAIDIGSVTVRYGKNKVLDDISLRVKGGSVFALLGRNGTGKSSLVRCLLGQQHPTAGSIRLFGTDVWKGREGLMHRVGVVPEDPDAPPEMTVEQIARFCSKLYRRWEEKDVWDRMKRFSVPLDTPFGQLSKGQKRQVALALALAPVPDLLVLDDPTLGLDVVARKSLFEEVVSELADRGMTIFLTTHDLAGVERIADRLAILRDGRIALEEDVETLKWRFRRLRYVSVRDDRQELEQLRAVGVRQWGGGVEAIVSNFDDLSFNRFRESSGVRDVQVTPMSLEEIFIAVGDEPKEEAV